MENAIISFLCVYYPYIIALTIAAALMLMQVVNIRQWLVLMCAYAEGDFGGGTGELKQRAVYDKFTQKYSFISKFVPYSLFKFLMEYALLQMKDIMDSNASIKYLIEKEGGKQSDD